MRARLAANNPRFHPQTLRILCLAMSLLPAVLPCTAPAPSTWTRLQNRVAPLAKHSTAIDHLQPLHSMAREVMRPARIQQHGSTRHQRLHLFSPRAHMLPGQNSSARSAVLLRRRRSRQLASRSRVAHIFRFGQMRHSICCDPYLRSDRRTTPPQQQEAATSTGQRRTKAAASMPSCVPELVSGRRRYRCSTVNRPSQPLLHTDPSVETGL